MVTRGRRGNGEALGSDCVIALSMVELYKISKIFLSINLFESKTVTAWCFFILFLYLRNICHVFVNLKWHKSTLDFFRIKKLLIFIQYRQR